MMTDCFPSQEFSVLLERLSFFIKMQQCSEAVKHKRHTGFSTEWECPQETWLVGMRVLFSPVMVGYYPCVEPSQCKEAGVTLQLWLILALRHLQGPPTTYTAGTTYSKGKTPHTHQHMGEGGLVAP